MGKFRIDAEVHWRNDTQSGIQGNIPIEAIAPGDGNGLGGSNEARSVADLLRIFDMANGARSLTIALKVPFLNLYFRPYWSIETISIGMYENSRLVALARCSSFKRTYRTPMNGLQQAVLSFHDSDGFFAEKT